MYFKGIFYKFVILVLRWEWIHMLAFCKCIFIIIEFNPDQWNTACSKNPVGTHSHSFSHTWAQKNIIRALYTQSVSLSSLLSLVSLISHTHTLIHTWGEHEDLSLYQLYFWYLRRDVLCLLSKMLLLHCSLFPDYRLGQGSNKTYVHESHVLKINAGNDFVVTRY